MANDYGYRIVSSDFLTNYASSNPIVRTSGQFARSLGRNFFMAVTKTAQSKLTAATIPKLIAKGYVRGNKANANGGSVYARQVTASTIGSLTYFNKDDLTDSSPDIVSAIDKEAVFACIDRLIKSVLIGGVDDVDEKENIVPIAKDTDQIFSTITNLNVESSLAAFTNDFLPNYEGSGNCWLIVNPKYASALISTASNEIKIHGFRDLAETFFCNDSYFIPASMLPDNIIAIAVDPTDYILGLPEYMNPFYTNEVFDLDENLVKKLTTIKVCGELAGKHVAWILKK